LTCHAQEWAPKLVKAYVQWEQSYMHHLQGHQNSHPRWHYEWCRHLSSSKHIFSLN
jgi:hypothetical protein